MFVVAIGSSPTHVWVPVKKPAVTAAVRSSIARGTVASTASAILKPNRTFEKSVRPVDRRITGGSIEKITQPPRQGTRPARGYANVSSKPVCNVNLILCNSLIPLENYIRWSGLQRHTDRYLKNAWVGSPLEGDGP